MSPAEARTALAVAECRRDWETLERVGASWHTALLADAALALPGLRPPIFPAEAHSDWDALLRFRHFLRHAYVVDLDASRLIANRDRLARAVGVTEAWIGAVLSGIVIA